MKLTHAKQIYAFHIGQRLRRHIQMLSLDKEAARHGQYIRTATVMKKDFLIAPRTITMGTTLVLTVMMLVLTVHWRQLVS